MTSAIEPVRLPDGGARPTDVVCLGHALVDRLAEASVDVVLAAGIERGAMTLVDAEAALVIESALDTWREVAGGSAANTAAGAASLGASVAFAGSIGADAAGARYVADLEASGVRCVARPVTTGEPTGVCHVLVTPDGDRSMATSLGAAGSLSPAAVDEVRLEDASVVYLEGYLLDAPLAAAALERAIEVAGGTGTLVALSLSDPFVVERHEKEILDLLDARVVDILFGNEEEMCKLSGAPSLADALAALERPGLLGFATTGAAGSVAWLDGAREPIPAAPATVVDTTGAGDLYAAGVLFGLTRGDGAEGAARIGTVAAAEVISHFGARPLAPFSRLVARPGE